MPPNLELLVVQLALQALPYIPKLIDDLKQKGELTPEQEKALDDAIAAHKTDPAWSVID
jgi:polyhydroxyalkanoate synthesis regulator phasin